MAAMTGLPYVEVRTASLSGGGSFVQNWFAELTGNRAGRPAARPPSTRAPARPSAHPGSGNGDVPITFSACDWQHATGGTTGGGGGAYYASPVYNGANAYGYGGAGQPRLAGRCGHPPGPAPGSVRSILLVAEPARVVPPCPTACPTWSGHALPGGFGVLETTSDPCQFVEYPHHWMHTDTGNNTSCNLDQPRRQGHQPADLRLHR